MLKIPSAAEPQSFESHAISVLRQVLRELPFVSGAGVVYRRKVRGPDWQPDAIFNIQAGGKPWKLICEVKQQAQPRHVRVAILQLKSYLAEQRKENAYGVLLAPYLSEDAVRLCTEAQIGYADLAGNCRLAFDHVYVERAGRQKPPAVRREQRSLFAPKSARVLRALLGARLRPWKVIDIAEKARVSLGQVSNVRKALLVREWAREEEGGVRVTEPNAILSAWRDYRLHARPSRSAHYSLLRGDALDNALRAAFAHSGDGDHAVLASFSSARWLAPFARSSTTYIYADAEGEDALKTFLKLQPSTRGENVVLIDPKDKGVFIDRIQPAPGFWTTGLVQTYLDLAASGERGMEAAEHLRTEKLEPMWKNSDG